MNGMRMHVIFSEIYIYTTKFKPNLHLLFYIFLLLPLHTIVSSNVLTMFPHSLLLIYYTVTLFPNHTVHAATLIWLNYEWIEYSRTPLIRPPSESHWCGRIRGMVAREGFVYEQKPLSVTRNVVVWEGWSLVRVVVRQGFYCIRQNQKT